MIDSLDTQPPRNGAASPSKLYYLPWVAISVADAIVTVEGNKDIITVATAIESAMMAVSGITAELSSWSNPPNKTDGR